MVDSEKRMRMFLSLLFLIYLVVHDFFGKIGFILAGLLVIGYLVDWYLGRKPKEIIVVEKPRQSSLPPGETYVFRALGQMMRMHQLEMRVRGTEQGWNITFLTSGEGLHRMVGLGSAETISEALAKAEEDFESKRA